MFRKESGNTTANQLLLRKNKGYYKDLNNSRDSGGINRSLEASIESSVEIVEDDEELDDNQEVYINNLEQK
jgi:hypothetical protein